MIRNIVFDLGGVLLDIDFKRTFDAFEALGIEYSHSYTEHPEILQLFINLEKGMYTEHGFHKRFRVLTGFEGCKHDLNDAINALLVDYWPDRIKRVQELSRTHNTYILSNTNEIHCNFYNQLLSDSLGIKSLDHLVKKAYYSHELKSRKPESEIYNRMIKDSGINPKESLFIDDRQENLDAAEKLGFKVMLVDDEYTIIEGLKNL